jgi:hypothetical protein
MKKRELDADTVAKCDRIFVDSIDQSRQEAGDLVLGFAGHEKRWDAVRELSSLVAGICPGRGRRSADNPVQVERDRRVGFGCRRQLFIVWRKNWTRPNVASLADELEQPTVPPCGSGYPRVESERSSIMKTLPDHLRKGMKLGHCGLQSDGVVR